MKRYKLAALLVIIALCIVSPAFGSTIVDPTFGPVFDSSGQPLSGGLLYTMSTGGSWPSNAKATYGNKAMTVANPNPVVLGSYGTALVYGAGQYKLWLTDSSGNTIWTIDNVDGIGTSTNFSSIGSYGNSLHTAISSIGGTPTHLLIDQAITLDHSDTVPATLSLQVIQGGSIVTTGYAITDNGPFTADLCTVFSGTGTWTFGAASLSGPANPIWWGGGSGGAAKANAASVNVIQTLTANSATPSVSTMMPVYKTNNNQATVITSLSDMTTGQTLDLIVADIYTTFSSSIKNLPPNTPQYTTLRFTYDGTSIYCVGPPQTLTAMYRNRLINGEMRIDQRNAGASQSITTSGGIQYLVDRWCATTTGGNISGQQVTGAGQFKNYYQLIGGAGNTAFTFAQRIESINISDLASTTVSLSAYVFASDLTTLTWTAYSTATPDAWSPSVNTGDTLIATGTWTLNSSIAQYTANISLPSSAANGIAIVFSGVNFNTGTLNITGVQVESGGTVTAFERRPVDVEFLRCQRYLPGFRAIAAYNTGSDYWVWPCNCVATTGTTALCTFTFLVPARITTTGPLLTSTAADFALPTTYAATTLKAVSAIALATINNGAGYTGTNQMALVQFTCATGLTPGNWEILMSTNGSTGIDYIYFQGAEL